MTKIVIPQKLNEVLGRDAALHGAIAVNFARFEPWISNSGLPFFPGYTDHGPQHISDVLTTASSLIADGAWEVLTAKDVAVLALAILLHDIGMHLTADNFRALVTEPQSEILALDQRTWSDLWDDYLREASRFDERTLTKIFGNDTPLNIHQFDINNLTETDHLLIGEFLRRHHCRVAHEIALWGVPGTDGTLSFDNFGTDLLDLTGLIARSHGMQLRDTFGYLESKYHLRDYQSIHTVFLMTILRIADYLQIQSERAPKGLLAVKKLRSPFSQREWETHHGVRNINSSHEDPEAIYVDVLPTTAFYFLKFKALFQDMQKELDQSWGALGEVYGRYDNLRNLSLTIRRLRSSLDETQSFIKKHSIEYLPIQAKIESNNTDLLKLLVGPLYGYAPKVAIRELIQNSVDACRERDDWLEHHPNYPHTEFTEQDDDVLLLFEQNENDVILTVSDKGIGMAPDTVINYFLRAGASFRNSKTWKDAHEDETGSSRILRGGRFGVGVLAYFLLGKTIEVTTRHISEKRGVKFNARLDEDNIELKFCEAPIGTTIRIKVTNQRVQKEILPSQNNPNYWAGVDWYFLSYPSVKIIAKDVIKKGFNLTFKSDYTLPRPHSELPEGWNRLSNPHYDDIHWTYNGVPRLSCNGIIIGHAYQDVGVDFNADTANHIHLSRPKLSIFDSGANLPLNLQRSAISGRLSFDGQLRQAVSEDFIAHLLVNVPTEAPKDSREFKAAMDALNYIGITGIRDEGISNFIILNNGIAPLDYNGAGTRGLKRILCMVDSFNLTNFDFSNDTGYVHFSRPDTHEKNLMNLLWGSTYYTPPINEIFAVQDATLLISKERFEWIVQKQLITRKVLQSLSTVWENNESVILQQTPNTDSLIYKAALSGTLSAGKIFELTLKKDVWSGKKGRVSEEDKTERQDSPIITAWKKLLGDQVIPYDMVARKTIFAAAYEALNRNIKFFEKVGEDTRKAA